MRSSTARRQVARITQKKAEESIPKKISKGQLRRGHSYVEVPKDALFEQAVVAYRRGDYVPAVKLWQRSAKKGNADAQYNLGVMYSSLKKGIPLDFSEAARWYCLAAAQGLPEAQAGLAHMYELGYGGDRSDPQDLSTILSLYKSAAGQGNAFAQFALGKIYDEDGKAAQDLVQAAEWYRLAAKQGHPEAQFELASMHHEGRGMPQDHSQAAKWYKPAAEWGHVEAQLRLGGLYQYGIGVRRNRPKAVRLFRQAAEQGNNDAHYRLGDCYRYGCGVDQDFDEAIKWLEVAAKRRNADAQFALASIYYDRGKGVQSDFVEAYSWFRAVIRCAADEQMHDFAAKYCDRLAAQMTAAELARAQKMMDERVLR